MQKFLAPFPLVRLLIPMALGIAAGYVSDISFLILLGIGCLSLSGILFAQIYLRKSSSLYAVNGLSVFVFFLCAGMWIVNNREQYQLASEAEVLTETPVVIRVDSDPETKENNVRCRARIIAVLVDSSWKETDAGVMLYLKRNTASEKVRYGDEVLVTGGVQLPMKPMNPGEFDYAAWLKRKGIGFVCFAQDKWSLEGHSETSWIKARALELRNYFKGKMIESGLSGQELAVSEALLLGQSSEINPQLLASYSASGTLHVLSVSGMHVALVFVVLLKLLAPLEKRRRTQYISFAIQFLVIWFYAFLTGMSPSVLRAVTMLSVIITGRMIRRKAHLMNTLAASAILLLIVDPMLLQDAGFLLSYCAVAGIVIVQPLIEDWWTPRSKIMKPAWSLVSVTLAAQVFTFPLGLYFFQQFPTWFIVTNLVIIPLSTICLYAGLFLLVISWWQWAATLFAVVFGFLIGVLNASVSVTEFMPAAVIQTASWSSTQIILLYGLVIFILLAFHFRIKHGVTGSLACALLLVTSIALDRREVLNTNEIVVFHINRGMVIGCTADNRTTLFSDSATVADPEQLDFHVQPHYEDIGIYQPEIFDRGHLDSVSFSMGEYRRGCIFVPQLNIWMGDKYTPPPATFPCDAFVIHSKNFWMIKQLSDVQTHEIILTGEVRPKWVEKWKEEGKRRKIPVHVTGEQGARVFTIKND